MIVALFVVISLIAQNSCKGEEASNERLLPAWSHFHEAIRRSSDDVGKRSSGQCQDYADNCAKLKSDGYCPYLSDYCKRTCGNCTGPPPSKCGDDVSDCASLKSQGYCQYFLDICKKTCGNCSAPSTPKPSPRPNSPKPNSPKPNSPKPNSPKPNSPKPNSPKPNSPKPNSPKPNSPKPNSPKPNSPKPNSPKPNSPKPNTPSPKPRGNCGKSKVQQSRIIAGVDAKKGAWPWIASLVIADYFGEKNFHFCGGSLIHPKWILTAAHCVDSFNTSNKQQMNNFKIRLGVHNRTKSSANVQDIGVENIYIHHTWATRSNDNWHDVALVKLKRPALLTDRVQTVCLPGKNNKPAKGRRCYLAGWGTVTHPGDSPQILQQAMLPVVKEDNCFNSVHMICAGYGTKSKTNACRGDSGGPFMCQNADNSWTVHGIASFVVEYCKYYTGFADVGVYLDWIRKYAPV